MDLGTIRDKLNSLVYTDIENFVADVRLVFENSNKYNLVCIRAPLHRLFRLHLVLISIQERKRLQPALEVLPVLVIVTPITCKTSKLILHYFSHFSFLLQDNSEVGKAGKNLEKYFNDLVKQNFSNPGKRSRVQRKR